MTNRTSAAKLALALRLLFQSILFITWTAFASLLFKASRPNPKWSYRQAVAAQLSRCVVKFVSTLKPRQQLSLEPGKEGTRFVVIPPGPSTLYKDVALGNSIQPAPIGGTWTPAPIEAGSGNSSSLNDARVLLHFHGGAYVLMTGRDRPSQYLARTAIAHLGCISHVFCPQYRLACNPDGLFPAALQDAITSYHYIVRTIGIPPNRVVVSGDSAGGNLALALLRYVSEHGVEGQGLPEALELPWPSACLLWSPWANVFSATDDRTVNDSPNEKTDIVCAEFGQWGARSLIGYSSDIEKLKNPYLSPLLSPFKSETPLWVHVCGGEIMFFDGVNLEESFANEGTVTELEVFEGASHDIFLFANLFGVEKQAEDAMRQAGLFIQKHTT